MKATITKRTMAVALLLCWGLIIRAQPVTQKTEGFLSELKNFRLLPSRTPKKAEEGEIKLTINLEHDQSMYRPGDVIVFNKDSWYSYSFSRRETTTDMMIVPDTYDIFMIFQNTNRGLCLVIKEMVDIQQNTEISLNPEMAMNHISVKNYGPDGNILQEGLGEWNDTGELVMTKEGNTKSTLMYEMVYCKEIGLMLDYIIWTDGFQFNEEWCTLPFLEIDVNDISDRYLFIQSRLSRSNDNNNIWYLSHFVTDDVKAGVLENDPQKYVINEEKWDYSPFGKDQIGWGHGILQNYIYDDDPFALGAFTGFGPQEPKTDKGITATVYVNSPSKIDNKLKMFTQTAILDYYTKESEPYYVWGVPFEIKDSEIFYCNSAHCNNYGDPLGTFLVLHTNNDGWTMTIPQLSPHPSYSYPASKRLISYGESCSINAVVIKNYTTSWMPNPITQITSCYVGRCGEIRWCDEESTVSTYMFNGEEVESGEITDTEGVFDVTIENTNMMVDGLNGRNTTCLHYDMTKEDKTPPTIEMLIFKNNNDDIIDRFAEATDGIMEFSAADFNYQYYEEYTSGVFDCQPLNMQVEYAPYGTEGWTALDIEEIPELFREIGWGYFYRASLKDVQGEAEKGWFDVRFTMSDNSGNTHVQTVSPAFRIDNCVATGISETVKPSVPTNRTYFSLDGKRSVTPQKGLNIVRQADGTVRKVTVK